MEIDISDDAIHYGSVVLKLSIPPIIKAMVALAFTHKLKRLDSFFIGALQKADPTFRTRSIQKQTAVNAAGFEIDVIQRLVSTSPDRDPKKRRKDALQADLVAHLIESRMPQYLPMLGDGSAVDNSDENKGEF